MKTPSCLLLPYLFLALACRAETETVLKALPINDQTYSTPLDPAKGEQPTAEAPPAASTAPTTSTAPAASSPILPSVPLPVTPSDSPTPALGAVISIPETLPKAPEPVESILRLQIFLDGQLFGPGKVDGRPGEFTTKALKRYQQAKGLPETELEGCTLDLSHIAELYTEYTIRQEDIKFIGEVPGKPEAQSKKKYMPYESLLEFLTERYHTSPELISWLNKPKKMSSLKAGDVVKVPNVEPFKLEELVAASAPETPAFESRELRIDTREKLLALYEGEKMLASLPITPGYGHLATPPGTWSIVGIAQMPSFRWDKSVLEYGVRSKTAYEIPIGPNNPVGVMWIGLSKPGIGIHGTNQPQTIGRSASHGCMRTANWDVVRLSKLITKRMKVVIEGPKPIARAMPSKTTTKPQTKPQTRPATVTVRPAAAPPPSTEKKWFQFWKKK